LTYPDTHALISLVLSALGHMQVMGVGWGLKAYEARWFEVLPTVHCRHEVGVCRSLHVSVDPKGIWFVLSCWWQFVIEWLGCILLLVY